MNSKRRAVWEKSNGVCWYCGSPLPEKGWHSDHCDAVYRFDGGMQKPHNHNDSNLVPSCAPCNLFKGVFSVEEFRHEISMQIDRARRASVNFRTAERFGLLAVTGNQVLFWFEKNEKRPAEVKDAD